MNFFTPEPLLPAGTGYKLYSPPHLAALALCAVLIALLCWGYGRAMPEQRRRMRRRLGGAVLLCEGLRLANLLLHGCLSVKYLPLHLCSLAVFLAFAHSRRGGERLGELLYCAGMPGALAALLFPDWVCYPPGSFHNLLAFLVHALLVAYPLMLVSSGEFRPSVRRLPWCLGALAAMAVPVYGFNVVFDTNFMFLRRPAAGSPLAWFAGWWGQPWYLLGYLPMIVLVWAALYAPFVRGRRV